LEIPLGVHPNADLWEEMRAKQKGKRGQEDPGREHVRKGKQRESPSRKGVQANMVSYETFRTRGGKNLWRRRCQIGGGFGEEENRGSYCGGNSQKLRAKRILV